MGLFDDFLRDCAEDTVNNGSGEWRSYAAGVRDEAGDVLDGRAIAETRTCPDCGQFIRRKGEDGRCAACTEGRTDRAFEESDLRYRKEQEEARRQYLETLAGEDPPSVLRGGRRR